MPETYEGWTRKFLSALGAPAAPSNLAAIYAIIASEGTSITWNPLAITGAGVPGNSVGVGNFPDEATGIRETINFLHTNGAQDYPGRIVKPLQVGNGRAAMQGFDATGAWTGSKKAFDIFNQIAKGGFPQTGGDQGIGNLNYYGARPLLADPGHGQGDIGSAKGGITDVLGIPNPLSGLEAIGHFFAVLGQGSTWVRIGEILGGIILFAFAVGVLRNDIYAPAREGAGLVKRAMEVGAIVG